MKLRIFIKLNLIDCNKIKQFNNSNCQEIKSNQII